MIKPNCKYLGSVLTKRPVLDWEHFAEFSMPRKEGKDSKVSLTETFRMSFLLYPKVTKHIPTTNFCLSNCWMAL